MPGIQNTSSFPKGLWEGVKSWWDSAAKSAPSYYDKMYTKESSTKAYEEYVQSVGLGIAPRKAEGQPIAFDAPQQGFVTRGTNAAYGLGIITTHEELKDNLYVKLTKGRTEKLRRSFRETKNINATNVFNRAFNANYAGGDGVSLLNTAHPNTSGGTWANKFTVDAALSQAALEDMMILMMQAKDDRGFIEPLTPKKIIVHPNNFFNAKRIVGTGKSVGSANNDINPINTEGLLPEGVLSNPYLTSTGAWFLPTGCADGMIWQEREALDIWEDNDSDTRNYKIAAYERYCFLWANPRGLYGSNAA
jgi:hypothetical protein